MTPADTDAAPDVPKFRYDARLANEIELRWQDRWETERTFWAPNPEGLLADVNGERAKLPKLYVLDMFPYPSGAGLHVGHPLGFIGTDVYARYQRMLGRNVLHAMGMDAFGLPAEQYAVQTGQHPSVTTAENIATYRRQLRALGLGHDPRRGVSTADPSYYHWTQWIFLQIFNSWYDRDADRARPVSELIAELDAGAREPDDGGPAWSDRDALARRHYVDAHRLAYIDEAPVNWCPGLGTVLANEEVNAEGRSERGNFPVYKRPLKQWMMRITAYADRLLDDLDDLDWPEPIKLMQRNWIGRSDGAFVEFPVDETDHSIRVFTTRPDTLFGATFFVLAPEHPELARLVAGTPAEEAVREYVNKVGRESAEERGDEDREKTGMALGRSVVNPVNGEEIPMFVADYVLMEYGTGAIMAVPGHDTRDYEFAQKFVLPVVRVIEGNDPEVARDGEGLPYPGDGAMVNSGRFDGKGNRAAYEEIVEWLAAEGRGKTAINYRLRDWLVSRQRYWGAPIPIVYCDGCGMVPVPGDQLPVELPDIEDYAPQGKSPLAAAEDWVATECPRCNGPARRETDTMDTFVDSSWYFIRYLDSQNSEAAWDRAAADNWLPVDQYIGGVEHAILHLMYARFLTKALADLGHLGVQEPFANLFAQGMITRDGAKMSKSRGNTVSPGEYVERHGADTARTYICFMGPPERGADWSDEGLEGVGRFLSRLWRLCEELEGREAAEGDAAEASGDARALYAKAHWAIEKATSDFERGFQFNTVIAAVMELVNDSYRLKDGLYADPAGTAAVRFAAATAASLIFPFAPHLGAEVWERLEGSRVWEQPWPQADPALLVSDTVTLIVQVNGKLRDRIEAPADAPQDELLRLARASEKVSNFLDGKEVVKEIVVPGKLVNLVAR